MMPPGAMPVPAIDCSTAVRPPDADAERAFACVVALLERLAEVLAAPVDPLASDAVAEFEAVLCDCIAHLRARGATRDEITSRLTSVVHGVSAGYLSERDTAARVAAVIAWCERREDTT